MSSRFHAWVVTADSNLIGFGMLYRSAIDHHHSTNTDQCAIGARGQFGGGGDMLIRWKAKNRGKLTGDAFAKVVAEDALAAVQQNSSLFSQMSNNTQPMRFLK